MSDTTEQTGNGAPEPQPVDLENMSDEDLERLAISASQETAFGHDWAGDVMDGTPEPEPQVEEPAEEAAEEQTADEVEAAAEPEEQTEESESEETTEEAYDPMEEMRLLLEEAEERNAHLERRLNSESGKVGHLLNTVKGLQAEPRQPAQPADDTEEYGELQQTAPQPQRHSDPRLDEIYAQSRTQSINAAIGGWIVEKLGADVQESTEKQERLQKISGRAQELAQGNTLLMEGSLQDAAAEAVRLYEQADYEIRRVQRKERLAAVRARRVDQAAALKKKKRAAMPSRTSKPTTATSSGPKGLDALSDEQLEALAIREARRAQFGE